MENHPRGRLIMARENKRKRDAKRFGESDRLFDLLQDHSLESWALPWGVKDPSKEERDYFMSMCFGISVVIDACKLFDTTNISDYYWSTSEKETWLKEDFPCCKLPIDPMFVEFKRPPCINNGGVKESSNHMPNLFGWIFTNVSYDDVKNNMPKEALDILHIDKDSNNIVRGVLIFAVKHPNGKFIKSMSGISIINMDYYGKIINYNSYPFFTENIGLEKYKIFSHDQNMFLKPALLALSFMHCKNITINVCEPNRIVNRERIKCGLKPFVRYNIIDIEHMKQILKTEGESEKNGIKKALHICRGHFSTYTEEKPLFGKIAGTFWVPQHVRGSAKHGVVISDYNMGKPKDGPQES